MAKLSLLVPLDNTGFSRKIIPTLNRLFSPEAYRVTVLHIARLSSEVDDALLRPAMVGVDYGFYMYSEPSLVHPIYDEEELTEFREDIQAELKGQVEEIKKHGYDAEARVLFGEPVKDIVAFAKEEKVDVVAMATHGRTGFDRFLLGSVAQDVLKHLTVPVLLVNFEEKDEA